MNDGSECRKGDTMIMNDRELAEFRKALKKTEEHLSKLEGVEVLGFDELNRYDARVLETAGFYDDEKEPDITITYDNEETLALKLIDVLKLETGQVWYLWLENHIAGIKILDAKYAMESMLKTDINLSVILSTEDKKTLYDMSIDPWSDDKYLVFVYDIR
jgi:hypothetical protein